MKFDEILIGLTYLASLVIIIIAFFVEDWVMLLILANTFTILGMVKQNNMVKK